MAFLCNVQLFQKGIEEIKLMKKLIYGKIDISAIENEESYMTKLAKIKLLNEKKKKYNDLATSEKIKSCSSKKGKKSRSNSSSNGNKKGGKNQDNSNNNQNSENNQSSENNQNGENNQNNENANNGSNGSSNGNDGSDDGEDKKQNNNFIENDSDNEEEEENQKQKSETNEDDNQNENNTEIKNNVHSNEDENLEENVYEQNNMTNLEEENEDDNNNNNDNIINRSDSSIKEYSYEDSRIEACIYENIKTGNNQIANDQFNENKKDYYGNPFTASSCEDAMKMSMENSSFANSNEINQEDKNKAVKKIKFQDEKNNDDKNPPEYSSFIKHYVTNVGPNNKHILKNYMQNFPIESQSFGLNRLYNETNSFDYNSLSSMENKKNCCNLQNFCSCFGGNNNNNDDDTNQNKSNNNSKESFDKYESNEYKTTKSNVSIHPGYYENFNYKNIFNTIKKYDCTNPTNYIQSYNCMKTTQEFIKNHSIEEGIEFIKNNVDFEKIKTNVDIENIARSLTMDSLKQNLSIDIIKNRIDINRISRQLNIRHIMSKIYIKNPKKNIDFQTIQKFIDINQITQNADSFDGSYELEDLFADYIQTYVDNIKRTIDIQAMKNNYFNIFQSCNPQLKNTNYIKSAAKSIQTINHMYSNNKLNFNLNEHKKYIVFNQKKSVNLIKSFYSKKSTFVKKKIEVNKKFLNNYFNACVIDCNNNSEMLGSNELAQKSFAEYQINKSESSYPEKSMDLEDMRLKSFFKTANYNDVQKKQFLSGMCCGGAKSGDGSEPLNNEPSLTPEQSINLEDMRLKSFFKTANYNDVENKKYCSGMCCGGAKSIDASEPLNNEPSLTPEQSINLEDMRLKSFFKTANYNDVQKKQFLSGMCCGGAKSGDASEPLNNEPSLEPEQSINLEDMRLKSFFKTANYNGVQKKQFLSGMWCGGAKSGDASEPLNNEPSLTPEQSINLEDMRLKSFFKTANYNDVQKKQFLSGMCCGGVKRMDDETLNDEPSLEPEQSINLEDMRLKSFFKTSNYNDVQKKGFFSGMYCGGAKSMNADETLDKESTVHFDAEHSEACDCPNNHLKSTIKHEDGLETNVTCFSKPNNNLRYMKVVLPNNEESDIIYDDRKKIFFDLDGNAYAHIVHNLYFNVKDKLIYEIYYVGEINYEQIRNSLIKFGNYMVTEKYAPCKIIMEMCKKFNNLMNNVLGVNKNDTYYLDRENLVEVIIK
ncbi:hypothetical protein YYC_03821 [Plasmodium yoelii 17X]|uniref:Uncharacterized protein n=1 Tax=Plasmodium yoelii 17X TaxID=1323249 RepID=V7PGW2_PLAYE|nr:hypothetical protein YYC_03821 [Plasmodium yoelii 17X]